MDPLGEVGDRAVRPAPLSLAAVAGGLAVLATVLVAALPGVRSAFRSPPTNVAIDTAGTLALALTSAIVAGRARRAARRSDLLLAVALLVTALSTLCFELVPSVSGDHTRTFVTWAGAWTRVLALVLLVIAALGPSAALEHSRRSVWSGLVGGVAATGVLAALAAALTRTLPAVDEPLGPHRVSRTVLTGPVPLTIIDIVLMMGLAAAAVGFAMRSERRQDPLLSWIAAGVALYAVAQLDFALFPSQYGNYVYIGDFVALAAFVVLLTGATVEMLSTQEALTEAAVREERRRLARDLHDGLAQELAFITAQTRRLAREAGRPERAEDVLAAAQRALEESRLAISGLVRRGSEPLERTLAQAATSTAARAGVEVRFDIEPGLDVTPAVQQALLRVQSQAIVNAAVHGKARMVTVVLRGGDELRLCVEDDGDGFEVDAPRRPDSLGLLSMHERAVALGGSLKVSSQLGQGTRVEFVLP